MSRHSKVEEWLESLMPVSDSGNPAESTPLYLQALANTDIDPSVKTAMTLGPSVIEGPGIAAERDFVNNRSDYLAFLSWKANAKKAARRKRFLEKCDEAEDKAKYEAHLQEEVKEVSAKDMAKLKKFLEKCDKANVGGKEENGEASSSNAAGLTNKEQDDEPYVHEFPDSYFEFMRLKAHAKRTNQVPDWLEQRGN